MAEKKEEVKGVRVLNRSQRPFTFAKKDVLKGGVPQEVNPDIIEFRPGQRITLTKEAAERLFSITIRANKYNEVENLDEEDKD